MSNTTRAPSTRKTVPGMGRIFQRGQTFWIAYYRHGKEHRESTHSVNENDATKLLKKRYGEIASRRFVGPQEERVMFEDLVKGIERDYTLRGLRSMRAAKGRMVHLKNGRCGITHLARWEGELTAAVSSRTSATRSGFVVTASISRTEAPLQMLGSARVP